jgi:heptosyltransferase-2
MSFSKILIIQTAFLGDVILATALIEKLHQFYPQTRIDFLLRKGNESLLIEHPKITKLYIWNKQQSKIKNLYGILQEIRTENYDLVINLQRFLSSGFLSGFSGAKKIIGFENNPLSFLFTEKYKHEIGNGTHEVTRNQQLIASITDNILTKPKLYPTQKQIEKVSIYQQNSYICIAPSSVWFTKQYPANKWADLIGKLPKNIKIYLLGSPADTAMCDEIIAMSFNFSNSSKWVQNGVENLCGKLNLLESAELMRGAMMNYVNDSAPLHLASAVNAPVCAVFCSTIPEFGFTPLSDKSFVVQITEKLPCRPCGLHGYKQCPEKHFQCATHIKTEELLAVCNS